MQILRYSSGQQYGAHYDTIENVSPRIATVLLYLNDPRDLIGGETSFPKVRMPTLSRWPVGGSWAGLQKCTRPACMGIGRLAMHSVQVAEISGIEQDYV